MASPEPLVVNYRAVGDSTTDGPAPQAPSQRQLIANLMAYVINVAITYGVGVGGLLDLPSNSQQSLKYQTLVTPIGWAFSIWGIIFTMQAVWVVWPLVSSSSNRAAASTALKAVGYKYWAIVGFQAAWTFAFALDQITLSAVVMMGICASLWWTVHALWEATSPTDVKPNYWLYLFPLTIHAGWITAATAVNLNVAAVAWGVSANGQFALALVSLLVLVGVACRVVTMDTTIPLVLAWACFGVFCQLQEGTVMDSITDTFSDQQIQVARVGAAVMAVVILAVTGFVRGRTTMQQQE
eukprot:CAMPEP_0172474880 /NCGR_PEP_ID=MMETSP1065-20121228/69587_1 /TAXON_ID=265537 /ORGANISM="Amphiprora paludosa, Strain CCMP125" /LENGTH=295 /DNA_ID=CAMNT_0013233073 /DNA_START=329 /DNA_END=1216 /DNA_ORIENTATION=+